MIKDLGPARGVSEFYTRATGRSSGQAMVVLGAAMQSPGFAVPFLGVDHHNNEPSGRGMRHTLDDHMQDTIMHIICKLDWRGFTIHTGDRTVTFNPIVTEAAYVEHAVCNVMNTSILIPSQPLSEVVLVAARPVV